MTEPITRRDFLKLALGGGGVALVLSACSPKDRELPPYYEKLKAGMPLRMSKGGEEMDMIFSYVGSGPTPIDELQIRTVNGERKFMPFAAGATMVRETGEILEPFLYRAGKSSKLKEEITVGLYSGPSLSHADRVSNLPTDRELWVLPVVTYPYDQMDNGEPLPTEINANPPVSGEVGLEKFAKGCLVGTIGKTLDGRHIFDSLGYVFDDRVLDIQK